MPRQDLITVKRRRRSCENVGLAASTENAQAEDHAAGARAILSATWSWLCVDSLWANAGAHDAGANDAGFRSTADVLLQPGQRVRLYAIQGHQGFHKIWTQRGREERLLALREGKEPSAE